MQLDIYTDGASRGNPGLAAIGLVIKKQGQIIGEYSRTIGQATNNQAEYQALIFGLKKAKELKAQEVNCWLDSKLVVEQVNRRYKIKNQDLAKLFIKVYNLSQFFKKINFYYLPREKNKQADKLANQAFTK